MLSDVKLYNPGARHLVPCLYLIHLYFDTKLSALPTGESFRLSEKPNEKYKVAIKKGLTIVVCNVVEGNSTMKALVKVKCKGNLTFTPNGNSRESKVAGFLGY